MKKPDIAGALKPEKVIIPPEIGNTKAGMLGITGMKVELQTSQINTPSVEFPTDEILLSIDIDNTGVTEIPPSLLFTLTVHRNNELIRNVPFHFENMWPYRFTDRFTHGLPVVYKATISCETSGWISPKLSVKSISVNEMELHPGGNPEFSTSMFEVKRFWHQTADGFKGYHRFSADIFNTGNGYSAEDTTVSFVTDTGALISLPVKVNTLPGPGSHKRFEAGVRNDSLPAGQHSVKAKIEAVKNETNKNNNVSGNAVLMHNTLLPELNELFSLAPEVQSGSKKVNFINKIRNKDMQFYKNLRLVLLKNDTLMKEWGPLGFAPRGAATTSIHEDIVQPGNILETDTYKTFITADFSNPVPPESTYLAMSTLTLYKAGLDAALLKDMVADMLVSKITEYDSSVVVKKEEVKFEIFTTHILLTLKGTKKQDIKDAGFTARIKFYPNVENNKLVMDILEEPDIEVDMGWLDIFMTIVLPGIYNIVKEGIVETIENKFPETLELTGVNLPFEPVSTALFDGKLVIIAKS